MYGDDGEEGEYDDEVRCNVRMNKRGRIMRYRWRGLEIRGKDK